MPPPTDDERWAQFKAALIAWPPMPTNTDVAEMLDRIATEPLAQFRRAMFEWILLVRGYTVGQLDALARSPVVDEVPDAREKLAARRWLVAIERGPVGDDDVRRVLAHPRAAFHWALLRNLTLTQPQVAALALGGRTAKIRRVARQRLQQQFGWTGDA